MHTDDFKELSRIKIIKRINFKTVKNGVRVILKTSQFNRITIKPYLFSYGEWQINKDNGYVDDSYAPFNKIKPDLEDI